MNAPHTCPKCGSTLAPDAPEGLCPACLMAGALPTDATIKLTPSQMRTPSHGPVAPPPEELAPLFPQLEILELLGRGGMGAVYKARQPKLNRFVALKIIAGDAAADPHFAERFQREAQALAKLNHPNIVSVFDFGMVGRLLPQAPSDAAERRTEDSPPHLYYFLMEFVDGANLRAMMQSGEMRPEAALALIPAFCDALQYAHDEGVVHRDIKPENVLVDKKGRLKIADFGLAKLTGSDAHDHTLTRTGMYLGTPRYMAPEQVEKPETVDHRADIYSLGVVFYEMLTGELPMGRFDPPSKKVQVDVKLDDIVLRSLEKEPSRRYQHASEIKTAVEDVRKVGTPAMPPLRTEASEQDTGVLFKIQTLPRCGRDYLMSLLIAPFIIGVFLLLPGALAYLLAILVGAAGAKALMIAAFAGGVVFLGTFALLCAGSVASVRVRPDGLTINRNVGPSRFLPWNSIRSIERMSFGEVAKEIALWPGFPPRGSIVCQAAEGYLRINTQGECWYFNPRDAGLFMEAIQRFRAPEKGAGQLMPSSTERIEAQHAAGWPAFAMMCAAFLLLAHGITIGVISAGQGAAWTSSPSPLGGTQAAWALVLCAAGVVIIVGALQMFRLRNYALSLIAAIVATLPLALLYHPQGHGISRHITPVIGLWALVTLLLPKVRVAFGVGASRPVATAENPRLSRMALIGAIWGLFGLIAVIPSFLLTKTVDLAEGRPSSLIYEQPPVAFTIFMGVLLFIGAGAPIGTTILGAISMSNIKKSGGKLYGLPLAFADTVFFPMLLLHGAMAVLLGLLILTIMKLAGVNAGLGALEMGLLAMLPLIADFFIVRALWRKVAGRPATAHSTHETPAAPATLSDATKKPRKRHLLTAGLILLFFAAFIFGIDFRGSSVMTTSGRNSNVYVGAFDPWFVYEGTSKGFHQHLQPFSWSFFALVVAGITFGALWRVGREDDGKTARDPVWWRDWWKQVGIWGGLLLIACVVRTAKDPQKVLQPLTSSGPLIVAEKIETRETDHYLCRYKISAPPDHRVAVWLETTREGKPVVLPGLKDQVSFAEQHPTGETFDGHVDFSLMNGSRISPDSKGRWRWDFKFDSGKGRFTPGGWIDNPFEGKAGVIMDLGPERWQPKPGETVSIMVIRAGREFSGSDFTQQPPGGEVELRLKARIDLVPLFHRRVSGLSSTSTEPDAVPGTPLGRIAAGFEIDTKLSDDDIRRALIEKLRTNPSKRADAEAILKSVGTPVTKETTPEDVLKALEATAATVK